MFLNSREDFNNYLSKNKKPFMATFYKGARQKLNILMKKNGTPEGGKWSFDEDNKNFLKTSKFQVFQVLLKQNTQKV